MEKFLNMVIGLVLGNLIGGTMAFSMYDAPEFGNYWIVILICLAISDVLTVTQFITNEH